MSIPHSQPFFDEKDQRAVAAVLAGRYVSTGGRAEELGGKAAAVLGKRWGVATQSGTDALTAAFVILGLKRGDKVAVPAYICSAPLDALAWSGLTPVPVDVDRGTLSICPARVNALKGVKAVLAAHLFGIPAPVGRITHRNIVEDCAQTFGVDFAGKPVGGIGRLAICSFYATKLLTTGHGGLLAGNERGLRDRAMRLFTHDKRDEWEPHLHFLMSDLNASLGVSQLAKLRFFIRERRRIARRYLAALAGTTRLSPGVYSRFLVAVADGASLEDVEARFRKAGIDAKRPVHRPLFRYLSLKDKDFPNAAWAHERILSVPLYPGMPEAAVCRIEEFLERSRNVIGRWPSA